MALSLNKLNQLGNRLCETLAPMIGDCPVGEDLIVSDGQYPFTSFEFFLPEVLRDAYKEWKFESLDGIYPETFRKTGEREIELIGQALFISDQTLAPIHLKLQLSKSLDQVSWLKLHLGETIHGACHREPYSNLSDGTALRLMVSDRINSIDWFYKAEYGSRETLNG